MSPTPTETRWKSPWKFNKKGYHTRVLTLTSFLHFVQKSNPEIPDTRERHAGRRAWRHNMLQPSFTGWFLCLLWPSTFDTRVIKENQSFTTDWEFSHTHTHTHVQADQSLCSFSLILLFISASAHFSVFISNSSVCSLCLSLSVSLSLSPSLSLSMSRGFWTHYAPWQRAIKGNRYDNSVVCVCALVAQRAAARALFRLFQFFLVHLFIFFTFFILKCCFFQTEPFL